MDAKLQLKAAQQLEKEGVLKELTRYAYSYQFATGYNLPRDWEPEDVVYEAITQLLTGQRNWDEKRFPDVTIVLKGIIKSLFSHIRSQKYNKTRSRPKDKDGNEINVDEFADQRELSHKNNPTMALELEQTKSIIENALENDDEAMEVYLAIIDGHIKPKDIAKTINVSVKEVNNRLKRLRRKCLKVTS